jgi:hypoxanthine phosphoribosyltransferase
MNQRLVTKKNRKVRRLRELYPEINCKIFYQRDYLHLLVKYGLEDPDQMEETQVPSRLPGPPEVTPVADSAADAG